MNAVLIAGLTLLGVVTVVWFLNSRPKKHRPLPLYEPRSDDTGHNSSADLPLANTVPIESSDSKHIRNQEGVPIVHDIGRALLHIQ